MLFPVQQINQSSKLTEKIKIKIYSFQWGMKFPQKKNLVKEQELIFKKFVGETKEWENYNAKILAGRSETFSFSHS